MRRRMRTPLTFLLAFVTCGGCCATMEAERIARLSQDREYLDRHVGKRVILIGTLRAHGKVAEDLELPSGVSIHLTRSLPYERRGQIFRVEGRLVLAEGYYDPMTMPGLAIPSPSMDEDLKERVYFRRYNLDDFMARPVSDGQFFDHRTTKP